MSIIDQSPPPTLPHTTRVRGSSELRGRRDSSPAPSDTSTISDDSPLPIETIQLPDKTQGDKVTLTDLGVEIKVEDLVSSDTIANKSDKIVNKLLEAYQNLTKP